MLIVRRKNTRQTRTIYSDTVVLVYFPLIPLPQYYVNHIKPRYFFDLETNSVFKRNWS